MSSAYRRPLRPVARVKCSASLSSRPPRSSVGEAGQDASFLGPSSRQNRPTNKEKEEAGPRRARQVKQGGFTSGRRRVRRPLSGPCTRISMARAQALAETRYVATPCCDATHRNISSEPVRADQSQKHRRDMRLTHIVFLNRNWSQSQSIPDVIPLTRNAYRSEPPGRRSRPQAPGAATLRKRKSRNTWMRFEFLSSSG
jgi:hypothetical protein